MEAEPLRVRLTELGPIATNNVYGFHPALRYSVAVGGMSGSDPVDDAVLERISALVPGILDVHLCAGPGPVGLAHLIEHLCIALQQLAGASFDCPRAGVGGDAYDEAVIPYEDESICRRAVRWAGSTLEGSPEFDARARLDELIDFIGRKTLPAQDRMLLASAHQRDVPVSQVAGRTFTLGQGCHQRRISATKTSLTNIVSNDLAANKDYARRILQERGLPVPRYARVYSRRAALEAAERIGFPVVLKPIFGSMGRGVTVGVSDARELRAAYRRVREHGRAVLVEELVEGDDHRLLVIGGELRAAAKRMPGHVVGDGTSTVRQLVDAVNEDPRRGHDHNAPLTRLELDEQAVRLLSRIGYDAESVPPAGETVFLRRNANLSMGGTAIDVTDIVHPDTRRVAERAARAIGLDIAGVDLLTTDITRPLHETGGSICEINSRPGIRKHIWPVEGRSRDVTGPIVDMLFPGGANGRIPVVAVVGEGPTELAARMLTHVLARAGRCVGLGSQGRVWIDGIELEGEERLRPPELVRSVVLDPDVDVAVLEFAAGDAAGHGLECDAFDIALVVDSGEEEGLVPETRTSGLGLVLASTRDLVVVDDVDPAAASIEQRSPSAEVSRISIAGGMPDRFAASVHRASVFAGVAAHRLGVPDLLCRQALASFTPIDTEPPAGGSGRRDGTNPGRES